MKDKRNKLREVKWSDVFWRGLYEAQIRESTYTVEIDYFDIKERISLYRDGVLVDVQNSPATFVLSKGEKIEVAIALYGVKYARLVQNARGGARAQQLVPASGSAEYLRLRFAEQHPVASRTIAFIAWAVLVVALVTQLPVMLNALGYWTGWSVPTFALPNWANTVLGIAGVLAALDRAFRMKHNPLLDD